MAKAIKNIKKIEVSEEEKRAQDLREVEDVLIANKDVLKETLDVLSAMQDRGILSLLNGLFGQGDKVLNIFVKAMDKQETTNTMKNLLLLVGALGLINVKQLEPILIKVNSGIAEVAEHTEANEKTSYFDLVRALKDPEVNKAITLMLHFLKGMGKETEHLERADQDNYKKQAHHVAKRTLE